MKFTIQSFSYCKKLNTILKYYKEITIKLREFQKTVSQITFFILGSFFGGGFATFYYAVDNGARCIVTISKYKKSLTKIS